MRELAGRVAVITGGASGIGLALGRLCAQEGVNVVLIDANAARLAEAGELLPKALLVPADTRDVAALAGAAEQAVDRFGAMHIVCANAGVSGRASTRLWEESEDDWRGTVDVNLHGTVNTLRAFLPLVLRNDEGHVVLTSSMAGVSVGATQAAYWATKHAVVSLSETLRLQLADAHPGVGVSVLLPGSVATNLGESRQGDVPRGAGIPGWSSRSIDPEVVAAGAIDAVRSGRQYVFSHVEAASRVRERVDAMLGDLVAFEEDPDEPIPDGGG